MLKSPAAYIIALFAGPIAYLVAIVAFPLIDLYNKPGPKAGERAAGLDIPFNPQHLLFDALLLTAIIGYLLAAYFMPATPAKSLRWLIIAAPIVSALLLIFFYPLTSTDVYDLLFRAHITNRGGNPLTDLPFDYRYYADGSKDALYAYVAWYSDPSPYGPAWELLAAAVNWLAGLDLLRNIFAFKLVALGSYAACAALVATIARQLGTNALRAYYLFAAAPLVLFDAIGNGHNDLTLVVFVLLAYWLMLRGTLWLALPALALAVLVKFVPLLLVPLLLAYAICRLGWTKTIRQTLIGGVLSVLVAVICYFPFWVGWQSIAPLHRASLFTNSLAAAGVNAAKSLNLNLDVARNVALLIVALLALALVGTFAWRIYRAAPKQAETQLVENSGALLLYFAAFCLVWWQPWYFIWAMPFFALHIQGRWLLLIAAYATTFMFYFSNTLEKVKIAPGDHENWVGLFVFIPLLAAILWRWWQSRRVAPQSTSDNWTASISNSTNSPD